MTRRSNDRSAVSLGVRTHSAHGSEEGGWATYVVLGGPISDPDILLRGRMQLCDAAIEGSEQPFHHAAPMDLKSGEAFIERCRTSSRDLAGRALEKVISAHGPPKACCVLTGPERPLPPLRAILASHALQHAAEREFYRDAVRDAAVRKGIATELVIEKALPTLAERLPGTAAGRRETLDAYGKLVGSPWRQDEKLAATAAWLALGA
ncbi:MAG TPA: hypothetical protein VKU90_10720 [Caulobacteraceae bacterium]|nr:hypothetical protein [Caulobacteraceae bacterium]